MECLSVKKLPIGTHWTYEVKLDGFRIEAVRTEDAVRLYSKHGKLLTRQFFRSSRSLWSCRSCLRKSPSFRFCCLVLPSRGVCGKQQRSHTIALESVAGSRMTGNH